MKIGEHVVLFADEQSKAEDAKNGFILRFSVAEITRIDVSAGTVDVLWMYADVTDGVFSRWESEDG